MKPNFDAKIFEEIVASSREDAWIETVLSVLLQFLQIVASSREDAWIETASDATTPQGNLVASSREDAWIETILHDNVVYCDTCRVLPRGRVD